MATYKNPIELANSIVDAPKVQGQGPKQGVHVRDWVKKNYPTEYQIDSIKYPFTFEELKKAWDEDPDNDFYKVASQNGEGFDSEVREEIFNGLVENLGGDYDDYYYKWLGKAKPSPRILNNQKKLEQAAANQEIKNISDRIKGFKDAFAKTPVDKLPFAIDDWDDAKFQALFDLVDKTK